MSSCWGKKLSSICPQLVGTLALKGFQALRGNPPSPSASCFPPSPQHPGRPHQLPQSALGM